MPPKQKVNIWQIWKEETQYNLQYTLIKLLTKYQINPRYTSQEIFNKIFKVTMYREFNQNVGKQEVLNNIPKMGRHSTVLTLIKLQTKYQINLTYTGWERWQKFYSNNVPTIQSRYRQTGSKHMRDLKWGDMVQFTLSDKASDQISNQSNIQKPRYLWQQFYITDVWTENVHITLVKLYVPFA